MDINFDHLNDISELFSDSNEYQQLLQFSNLIPGAFGIHDLSSNFILLNQQALDDTNLTKEQAIGANYYSIKTRLVELSDHFFARDQLAIENKKNIRNLAWQCNSECNDYQLVMGNRKSIVNKHNAVIGVALTCIDVTDIFLQPIHNLLIMSGLDYYSSFKKQFEFQITSHCENQLLGKRQTEILFLLLRGRISKEIAAILNLSPRTVEAHIDDMKHKLNCSSRSELLDAGINMGYLGVIPESLLTLAQSI